MSPTILRRDAAIRKYGWKGAVKRTIFCPDCGEAFSKAVDYHRLGKCGEAFFTQQARAEHGVAQASQASTKVPDVSKDSVKPEANKAASKASKKKCPDIIPGEF